MIRLVDAVNFNADASCLDSARWLTALNGRAGSELCRWLGLYVRLEKKVILGLTGATLADISIHNPQALELLRANPDIFQGVIRPFSHDIALLRSREGFMLNLQLGTDAVRRSFTNSIEYYLPPEFMLSNEQTALLAHSGIAGTFVNAERLATDLRPRIPDRPYWLRCLGQTQLRCLPVAGKLTQPYLDSLHSLDARPWNQALQDMSSDFLLSWRDGESSFLLPNGVDREHAWLAGEAGVERAFISELPLDFIAADDLASAQIKSYPAHSFLAWMREFRMMGYLNRLQILEPDVAQMDCRSLLLWLQAINSDVMSSVEKTSPQISMRSSTDATREVQYTLLRSERGFEGEECLSVLERLQDGDSGLFDRFINRSDVLACKLSGRLDYLKQILSDAA